MNYAMRSFGTAVVLMASAGCDAVSQKPEIRSVTPHVVGIDLKGVALAFNVEVHNPYPIALRTPSFRYGIDIENATLFESEEAIDIDLPARQVGTATLPVRIAYADLFKSASSLVNSSEVRYRLHGVFIISVLGQSHELPLMHEGTFPVLRLPTFSVKNVDFSDISLSSAKVTLEVEIDNPNVFDIGAEGLGYEIQLGGVRVGSLSASTVGPVGAGEVGNLTLDGEISARSALIQLLANKSLGDVKLMLKGSITTPYGAVALEK